MWTGGEVGMTRKEAVEILEEVKTLDDSMFAYSQAYNDALDMAIEALKAQEPRLVTEADFDGADEYGYLPVWVEDKDDSEIVCDCITKTAITNPDDDNHYRFWTSRPTDEQRGR